MDNNIITDEFLNKNGERRYRVINKESGEVLADGNGYGFKTRDKAHKAYWYITRDKSQDDIRLKRKVEAYQFLRHHFYFFDILDSICDEINYGERDKSTFNVSIIYKILKEHDLKTDINPKDLFYAYLNPPTRKQYLEYKEKFKNNQDLDSSN